VEQGTLNSITPFIRMVKIQKTHSLSGEWVDFDNVFTYIESGEADFIIDGTRYHVKAGNAIVMHPFLKHIIHSTSTDPLVQYIFHFDLFFDDQRSLFTQIGIDSYDVFSSAPDNEMLLNSIPPVTFINHLDQPYLKNRFLIMLKEYYEKKNDSQLILKSIAIELLAIFIRNQTNYSLVKGKMTRSWAMLEKAITYINLNYGDEYLDNVKISLAADVTPNYISQAFKKQLRIPMHRYINHIRIERAKALLVQGDRKFTEIASIVGFSGIHVFSKVFKKTVGMTPSEFIASNSTMV
jgi:AraC-like DNA-binding protein